LGGLGGQLTWDLYCLLDVRMLLIHLKIIKNYPNYNARGIMNKEKTRKENT
jgi:hypothetical protein